MYPNGKFTLSMKIVTIEEAVGLMINLDYIPAGFTVLEMTEAFADEAENNYAQYRTDELKLTRDVCNIRHVLAQTIFDRINTEIASEHSLLDFDVDSECLTLDSLITWSIEEFGISIQCPPTPNDTQWRDVKIKIYDKHKIGLFINDKHEKTVHFRDIGLMGKNKNIPNLLGGILIGLSDNQKYPPDIILEGKHKKAISDLRNCLEKLTGISKDPFQKFNPKDGWRPAFELIDDRRNADERAKKNAIHVNYDEYTRDFDDEDDDAGRWIEDNS